MRQKSHVNGATVSKAQKAATLCTRRGAQSAANTDSTMHNTSQTSRTAKWSQASECCTLASCFSCLACFYSAPASSLTTPPLQLPGAYSVRRFAGFTLFCLFMLSQVFNTHHQSLSFLRRYSFQYFDQLTRDSHVGERRLHHVPLSSIFFILFI